VVSTTTTSSPAKDVSIDKCTLVSSISKNKQHFVTKEIELANTGRELSGSKVDHLNSSLKIFSKRT
jgi:hypothetical protein